MNREEAKALLPVMQAFAEGKDVEYRPIGNPEWRPATAMMPVYHDNEYRVKPEKVVQWLNIYRDGHNTPYATKYKCDRQANTDRIACIRIEYTEGEGLDQG